MAIYVDTLIDYGWKLGPSCHMTADTEDELHEFAEKIGLKRSWYQNDPKDIIPHYDLTANKRRQAVKNGAVEIDWRETARRVQEVMDKRKSN